jgi:hypothetical protein
LYGLCSELYGLCSELYGLCLQLYGTSRTLPRSPRPKALDQTALTALRDPGYDSSSTSSTTAC